MYLSKITIFKYRVKIRKTLFSSINKEKNFNLYYKIRNKGESEQFYL